MTQIYLLLFCVLISTSLVINNYSHNNTIFGPYYANLIDSVSSDELSFFTQSAKGYPRSVRGVGCDLDTSMNPSKIWCFGGNNGISSTYLYSDVYTFYNNSFKNETSLGTYFSNSGNNVVIINGIAYIVDYNRPYISRYILINGLYNEIWATYPETMEWSRLTSNKKNTLYLGASESVNTVYSYNISTFSWKSFSYKPQKFHRRGGIVYYNNKLILIGGYNVIGEHIEFMYPVSNNVSYNYSDSGGVLQDSYFEFSTVLLDNGILYILGGYVLSNGRINNIYVYNIPNDQLFQSGASLFTPRSRLPCTLDADEIIWCMAGYDQDGGDQFFNDIEFSNSLYVSTETPTLNPTQNPSSTKNPTKNPSQIPSNHPTVVPTLNPSTNPSETPSNIPTVEPTLIPSNNPSFYPSQIPSKSPSQFPSLNPTTNPTVNPISNPTTNPTTENSLSKSGNNSSFVTIIIILSVVSFVIILIIVSFTLWKSNKNQQTTTNNVSTLITTNQAVASPSNTSNKAETNTKETELEKVNNNGEIAKESEEKESTIATKNTKTEEVVEGANKTENESDEEMYIKIQGEHNLNIGNEGDNDGEIVINELPNNVKEWDTNNVSLWLKTVIDLPEYCSMFEDNQIDGTSLLLLDKNTLDEMGIKPMGHKLKITNGIEDLTKTDKTPMETNTTKETPNTTTGGNNQTDNGQGYFE